MRFPIRFSRRASAASLFTFLLAGAAHAQLTVNVTTADVDDESPACFMHGSVATQTISVTNTGAQAVTATLGCSVPSGLLRVSGTDQPRSVAPGATETLRCGLYDFQDPPDTGASVTDFNVDVNGATSTHTVNVQCRPAPKPVQRCAALKIQTAGRVGQQTLASHAHFLRSGRSNRYLASLLRGDERLSRGFSGANARWPGQCHTPGDYPTVQQALVEMHVVLEEQLGGASGRCDSGRVRSMANWYGSSLRAWSRAQRRGDPTRLMRTLVKIDRKFQHRWDRLGQRFGAECTLVNPILLRDAVDRPIHVVLDAQGARRPNPEQWQAALQSR